MNQRLVEMLPKKGDFSMLFVFQMYSFFCSFASFCRFYLDLSCLNYQLMHFTFSAAEFVVAIGTSLSDRVCVFLLISLCPRLERSICHAIHACDFSEPSTRFPLSTKVFRFESSHTFTKFYKNFLGVRKSLFIWGVYLMRSNRGFCGFRCAT